LVNSLFGLTGDPRDRKQYPWKLPVGGRNARLDHKNRLVNYRRVRTEKNNAEGGLARSEWNRVRWSPAVGVMTPNPDRYDYAGVL
jgi:hypothetical protein